MIERLVLFDGIDNFRDYGGYAVEGGGRLRSGWLYRSAHHGDASTRDLQALNELGVAAVIDLRGPAERTRSPTPRPDGFKARIFETDVETFGVAPHIEVVLRGVTNPQEARAATRAVFEEMPCRPVIIATLRNYFATLAETDGSSLVHCSAGKDRTGLAVALLHALLGVHPDDIVADFLLTNTIGRHEARIAANVAALRRNFGAHLGEDTARTLVTVEAEYLTAAFAVIGTQFGSIENYLRAQIGVDHVMRDAIREKLVA